jgi:hypothetical protein
VVEVRAGLGQLAAAAQEAGARVHGLVEADPLARAVLRCRFPEALVSATAEGAARWPRAVENQLVVFVTVPSKAVSAGAAATVRGLAHNLGAVAAVVAVLEPRNPWVAEGAVLDWDAQSARAGLRRAEPLGELNAAALGAGQDQQVGLLVYTAGPLPREGRRVRLVHGRATLAADEVPAECGVPGSLEARQRTSESPLSPTYVGVIRMGGAGAQLFTGALVHLATSGRKKWWVVGPGAGGSLEVVATKTAERQTVELAHVRKTLPQSAWVVSIDGTSQRHPEEVRATVLQLEPSDGARRAGAAGRGVAVVVAEEMVQRTLEALGGTGIGPIEEGGFDVGLSGGEAGPVRRNADRCAGGPQRHT